MAATLSDIAKETNTSVSTVSRVLSGGPVSKRISKETRERVHEAAKRLGYRPNLLARSLRTRRSNTIALLVSDIANPWYGQLASLIEKGMREHGYSMFMCNSGENPETEAEYLNLLPQKGIDGLILVPLLKSKKVLEKHLPAKLPLTIVDRAVQGVTSSVSSDQDGLVSTLADALAKAGVKTLAVAHGPLHVGTHKRRLDILAERFKIVSTHEGSSVRNTGRDAIRQFAPLKPDAVVGTNNAIGQGLLDKLETTADWVPVMGIFDHMPMMDLIPVPIVASVQDVPALAKATVDEFLPLLRDPKLEGNTVVVPSLIHTNKAYHTRIGE